MKKDLWGSSVWSTIHYVALGYPNNPSTQDEQNYKNFYENLGKVLPCDECSTHYQKNFKESSIDKHLDSKENLFIWTVNLHNTVNKMLNKDVYSVTEAKNMCLNRNTTSLMSYMKYIIILILISLIFYYFTKNNKKYLRRK